MGGPNGCRRCCVRIQKGGRPGSDCLNSQPYGRTTESLWRDVALATHEVRRLQRAATPRLRNRTMHIIHTGTRVVLLLVVLANLMPDRVASAQSIGRFEVGGQVSGLRLQDLGATPAGFGGRF